VLEHELKFFERIIFEVQEKEKVYNTLRTCSLAL